MTNGQTVGYKYSVNGDLTAKTTGEQYKYDIQGNLTSIIGNGLDKQYTYNGNGNRLSETTDGETIFYVNDLNRRYEEVLQTYGDDGNIINTYTYGIDRINSVGQDNETYLYDGRGSVVGSIENDMITSYAYTAYGDLMPDSPEPNVFGYNGEQSDYSIGIQYLRARYYDVTINRFFQEDDYRGNYTNPISMNRYAYTHNNPVMGVDPSGYRPIEHGPEVVTPKFSDAYYAKMKQIEALTDAGTGNSGSSGSDGGGGGKATTPYDWSGDSEYFCTPYLEPEPEKEWWQKLAYKAGQIGEAGWSDIKEAGEAAWSDIKETGEGFAELGKDLYSGMINTGKMLGEAGEAAWSDIKETGEGFIELKEDIKNFDINNTDEAVVLNSNWISGYKGVPVIRIASDNTSITSCAIFSIIFLNKTEVASDKQSIVTVKHEYGHTVQEDLLGTIGYVIKIAYPSLANRNPPSYYSQLWERGADVLGGVTDRKDYYGNKYAYSTTEQDALDYIREWYD